MRPGGRQRRLCADRDRLGPAFLFPGVGFGGSCFPKDVRALERLAHEVGYDFQIITAVHHVNDIQKRILVDRIRSHYGGDLSGRRFALWGLAFKPRTDDVREAPSLAVIETLLASGARVSAYDPEAVGNTWRLLEDRIEYAANVYDPVQMAALGFVYTSIGRPSGKRTAVPEPTIG